MDVDSPNSLKRCSSAPQINNLLPTSAIGHHHHSPIVPMEEGQSHQPEDNQLAASAQIKTGPLLQQHGQQHHQQQNLANSQLHSMSSSSTSSLQTAAAAASASHRESTPTSFSNIFTPRVRRFSASFSPLAVISNGSSSPVRSGSCTPGPRLTPRISQLRQEECADLSNSREVNHEREIHSAMQMSQSYEDLTLVTENWSFSSTTNTNTKHNDDLINPLHVALPSIGTNYCSSPSPTSRAGLGLQYPTTSPSPTRKYVTRRSMSPCPIRPSPLSSVKRKFDLEGGGGSGGEGGNNYGNCYSPPPLKKIFTGTDRGTSPVCQTPSPSPICASPDSSTASFENGSNNASSGSGRITPKFFVTRLSASGQLFAGNGGGGGGPPPASTLNAQLSAQVTTAGSGATVTESPPSSSSSSSFMMMDCGVSSSSGGVGRTDRKLSAAVSSSGEEGKIDCDEDITDLNVIGSSTSMATTESSEAAMEEVIKTTRALDSESELQLDSRSTSNCHRLSSSGSVGTVSSGENNNSADASSSVCPLAANGGASSVGSPFMAANIQIAET
uniref:Uncharacterized protein n=1 Tax=Culex tarsalis TaxID=7177 RepID=A0A1Q3G0Z2_CULTA